MPEQQSFVLYIVVGSGSKSGSRLPKTAPGAVFKVRLHGSLATGQKRLLASKSGFGSRLKGEAVCSQKRHKIGSPASETSSGAAPTTCLFFAVEFAGWGLASGGIPGGWRAVSGPHLTSSHDNINAYCDPK